MTPFSENGALPIPAGARPAARVILLNPDNRVLLLRAEEDGADDHWWVMPGGGLQPGETFEQAVVREAFEETGVHVDVSRCVWIRHHIFEWNRAPANQYERFFVARTEHTAISPARPDGYVTGYRWWACREIIQSDDTFAPRRLGRLLPAILEGSYSSSPIDCGV